MIRRSPKRVVAALAMLIFALAALASPGQAAAQEGVAAVVVSTESLDIRACPETTCAVRASVPLGDQLTITGDADDGVVPVSYGNTTGFASSLFLATDPSDPPFLLGGSEGCQRVAFIFNVGVGFEPDEGILDTLAAEQVPATMFVMGWWAAENPPILKRMVDEGYLIGSHGYEAIELTTRSDEEVRDDVARATTTIEQAAGQPLAPYFTPYAAAIDNRVRSVVADQGLLPVGFEVSAADYGPDVTEDSVYRRVMDNVHDGAIVELHLDAELSAETTGRALPRMIDDLRAQGYRFVTVPEMMQPC